MAVHRTEVSALGLLCMVALCLSTSGCEEVDVSQEPGAVSLSWRISPMGCRQSGVQHVQIAIEGLEAAVTEQVVFDCELGRALLEELLPGRYALTLIGVDDRGREIFTSGDMQIGVSPLVTTALDEIRLTAKAAVMDIGWYFDNGRLCASNSVERIAIGVYDKDAFAIDEATFECDLGVGTIFDLQSGAFIIEAVGLSADGTGIFRGLQEVQLDRGDHRHVEVVLKTCGNGC